MPSSKADRVRRTPRASLPDSLDAEAFTRRDLGGSGSRLLPAGSIGPAAQIKTLQRLRSEAAAEVERLLAFLDDTDADADLEPSGDESEPSLGAAEPDGSEGPPPFDYWSDGPHRTNEGSQLRWADGSTDECEHCADLDEDDSHDGREPDVEDEPSLGAFDRMMDQSHAWRQISTASFTKSDAEVELFV